MAARFERDVTVLRPNLVLRASAAAPALIAVGAAMLLAQGTLTGAGVFSIVEPLALAIVLSAQVRRRNPWPRKSSGRLAVDSNGVIIDGARVLDRTAIRRAYLQPRKGAAPTVRVTGRLGLPILEVQVANEAEGQALVDALGLGVSQQATRFMGVSPALRSERPMVMLGLAFAAFIIVNAYVSREWHSLGVLRFLTPLLVFAIAAVVLPSSIHVGADGILTTWMGTRRFYAFADIAAIVAQGRGVRLWMHSGVAVDLPVILRQRSFDRLYLDALVARAREAHRAATSGQRPVDVVALVARGGRTAEDWGRAVRSLLGGGDTDYRSNAVPAENLWRIAEDPTAEETARVGAAVALRGHLDDAGRARLVQVAEASVSPRVRVALRAAANDEGDEALVEAMQAYEAERAGGV